MLAPKRRKKSGLKSRPPPVVGFGLDDTVLVPIIPIIVREWDEIRDDEIEIPRRDKDDE